MRITQNRRQEEIIDGDAALRDWMADLPRDYVAEPDIPVQENIRKIVAFMMQQPRFAEHNRHSFLDKRYHHSIRRGSDGR